MPSAKQDERALVIIHSASNSLRNRSFLPKARSVLVARSGSCPSGTPPGAEAGNEIPSPQVLSIWIIEESNTWSSKASGGMWKWSTFAGGAIVAGRAHSKQAATVAAEKAIDGALAIKKVRLVPPERSD
jgi:hypothetical protein